MVRGEGQTEGTILSAAQSQDFCQTEHLKLRGNTIWWQERIEVT